MPHPITATQLRANVYFVLVLAAAWVMPKGYRIVGVTDRALRGALYSSLEEMGLTFEDRVQYTLVAFTDLTLIPGDIRLRIAARPWGICNMWLLRHSDVYLLQGMADGMKRFFEKRALGINGVAVPLELFKGALLLALGGYWLSSALP